MIVILILLVLAIACGIGFSVIFNSSIRPLMSERATKVAEETATKEAQTRLTEMYGETVRNAVKNYWLIAHSLEADQDPAIRSQVETGQSLKYWSRLSMGSDTESFHLVAESVLVGKVRVLEYDPEKRFKAVVCTVKQTIEVTSEGERVQSLPPYAGRIVYVFLYEDDAWKLAGSFNITEYDRAPRDWWYAPAWLKEIIQELPDWESCDWLSQGSIDTDRYEGVRSLVEPYLGELFALAKEAFDRGQNVYDAQERLDVAQHGMESIKVVRFQDSEGEAWEVLFVYQGIGEYGHGYYYTPSGKLPLSVPQYGPVCSLHINGNWYAFNTLDSERLPDSRDCPEDTQYR